MSGVGEGGGGGCPATSTHALNLTASLECFILHAPDEAKTMVVYFYTCILITERPLHLNSIS